MPRKPLPGFGRKGYLGKRGAQVRAFVEAGLVRVQWGKRRQIESWPDTPENRVRAIAFGEGVADRLGRGTEAKPALAEPVTLRQMWDRYKLAEFASLRPRTQTNYEARWTKFEIWKGARTVAASITRDTLDEFRAELRKQGHVVNQVARHIDAVKRVFRWAVERDLIPPTKVTSYRFKRLRDDKSMVIPEYSLDEARRLLGYFDPRDARRWRPYVLAHIAGLAGPRSNAALQLRWDDIDLGSIVFTRPVVNPPGGKRPKGKRVKAPRGQLLAAFEGGTIHWRPEHDKLGKDRVQPVAPAVVEALWVAYGWRLAYGYTGPFVLFRPGAGLRDRGSTWRGKPALTRRAKQRSERKTDQPWTYSAANSALRGAEVATKVEHIRYRAYHAFRRFVVNQILEATGGNLVLAGQYIGDDDLRTLQRSYVRPRPEQLRSAADHMAATTDGKA